MRPPKNGNIILTTSEYKANSKTTGRDKNQIIQINLQNPTSAPSLQKEVKSLAITKALFILHVTKPTAPKRNLPALIGYSGQERHSQNSCPLNGFENLTLDSCYTKRIKCKELHIKMIMACFILQERLIYDLSCSITSFSKLLFD